VKEAKNPNGRVEIALHAWRRLGECADYRWPQTPEDWQEEQSIQMILKQELNLRATGEPRFDSLLAVIADANLVRELTFRRAAVDRHMMVVRRNSQDDPFLKKLVNQRVSATDDVNEIRAWEKVSRDLAASVAEPNWPQHYDLRRFYQVWGRSSPYMAKGFSSRAT